MQLLKKSKCKKKLRKKKKKAKKTKLPFPANDIQKQKTVNKVRLEMCPGPDPPPQSLPSEWAPGVGRWVRLRSQPGREMPRSRATSKRWGVLLHPSPTSAHPIHLHNNPEALNQQSSPPRPTLGGDWGRSLDAAAGRACAWRLGVEARKAATPRLMRDSPTAVRCPAQRTVGETQNRALWASRRHLFCRERNQGFRGGF